MTATQHAMRALILTLTLLAGCASTKVSNETQPNTPACAPSMIYVRNFDLGEAQLKSDPGTLTGRPRLIHFGDTDPVKKLHDLSDLLAKTIVDDLNKAHYPAQRLAGDTTLPTNGWLVAGRFLEVTEGNHLQSAVIGFGVGGSDAKLYVIVRDLSKPPEQQDLLSMNVDSDPSKIPGGGATAVITHTPYGMAAKFVLDRNASDKDIERAGHEVASQLQKLAEKRSQP